LAEKVARFTPVTARPANDKVLNVFAPVIAIVVADAEFVNATLLKVRPPDAMPVVALVRLICDDPALNVKLFIGLINIADEELPLTDTTEPFSVIERVFEFAEDIVPRVSA
jgi:hypothetical protein